MTRILHKNNSFNFQKTFVYIYFRAEKISKSILIFKTDSLLCKTVLMTIGFESNLYKDLSFIFILLT